MGQYPVAFIYFRGQQLCLSVGHVQDYKLPGKIKFGAHINRVVHLVEQFPEIDFCCLTQFAVILDEILNGPLNYDGLKIP